MIIKENLLFFILLKILTVSELYPLFEKSVNKMTGILDVINSKKSS